MRRTFVLVLALSSAALAFAACHGGEIDAAPPRPSASPSPSSPPSASPACSGAVLFGRPVSRTGLTDDQCQPRCSCGGAPFEAPLYTAADADELLTWTQIDPLGPLASDPYAEPPPPALAPETVCALTADPPGSRSYRVATFATAALAASAGATPTHYGACGLCSSLANLAVYMRYPDLTAPVRDCGLMGASGDDAKQLACIEALGFEHACAQIWSFNTDNTRAQCLDVCIAALGKPYQLPDGSLNPCLQCDEDESGAVFKAVAGRTRRNTGIASAMCRPCSEVRPLLHEYGP